MADPQTTPNPSDSTGLESKTTRSNWDEISNMIINGWRKKIAESKTTEPTEEIASMFGEVPGTRRRALHATEISDADLRSMKLQTIPSTLRLLAISSFIHWALMLMPKGMEGRASLAEASICFHNYWGQDND